MAPSPGLPEICSTSETNSDDEATSSENDFAGDSRRASDSLGDVSESPSFASGGDRDGEGQFDTFLCSVSEASIPALSSESSSSDSGLASPPRKFTAPFGQTAERVELLRRYLGTLLESVKSLVPARCDGGACTLSERTGGRGKPGGKAPLITVDLTQAGKEKPLLQDCIRSLGWRANESFFSTGRNCSEEAVPLRASRVVG